MRPTIFAVVAAAATLAAAPTNARAQQPVSYRTTPLRLVATYEFRATTAGPSFVNRIVLADSAGSLIARAELQGDRHAIPMTVDLIGEDVVLQGALPEGIVTLVIESQADAAAPTREVSGRWSLGRAEGALRGRVQR